MVARRVERMTPEERLEYLDAIVEHGPHLPYGEIFFQNIDCISDEEVDRSDRIYSK